jgi:XTP/dITP diphosphohydrolase
MKLVFATNNPNKLAEIKRLLPDHIELLSMKDIQCFDDIPETAMTLEGNAHLKASYIASRFGYNCFADDTGLEIDFLNGAPGVYSARYAGSEKDAEANMTKVLDELKHTNNRKAQFRTAISLIIDGREQLFEGVVNGSILRQKQGEEGFGYDPIFQPENEKRSFAEMSMDEKGKISHRGRAVAHLIEFIKQHY